MKTIGNYNAQQAPFATYLVSIALVFPAFLLQIASPGTFSQGIDLTESFFINVGVSQFAHLSWTHLFLNTAGLALVTWGLAAERRPLEWLLISCLSLLAVPLWLSFVEPLEWYCGLSGALHAQFAALLFLALLEKPFDFKRNWPLWIMAAGLSFKLIIEFFEAREFNDLVGGPIAIEAHRGGVIFGILIGGSLLFWQTTRTQNKSTL